MDIREGDIVWSDKDFVLKDFIQSFELPQIVKVEEGYNDECDDERTLSTSQLLTLHSVREFQTVTARDAADLHMCLPVKTEAKVELILGENTPSYYESVEELAKGFPPFVSSVNDHPWLNIVANDVLELKKKVKKFRGVVLVCKVFNTGRKIELPLAYVARFKVLGVCPVVSPTLEDVIKYCKLPCEVNFIDDTLKIIRYGYYADKPFALVSLGPISLLSTNNHKVVFTTTWEDKKVVLPLPINLQIRVVAALGAIENNKTYSKLCQIAHNKTKSDELVLKYIRHGECKVLLGETSEKADSDNDRDYQDVGPKVPPRNLKPRSLSSPTTPAASLASKHDPGDVFSEENRFSVAKTAGRIRSISENFPPDRRRDPESEYVTPSNTFHDGKDVKRDLSISKSFKHVDASKTKPEVKKRVARRSLSSVEVAVSANKRESKCNEVTPTPPKRDNTKSRECNEVTPTPPKRDNTKSRECNEVTLLSPKRDNTKSRECNEVTPTPPKCAADRLNRDFQNSLRDLETQDVRHTKDVKSWTIDDVSECLVYCRLGAYVEKFKEEKVDGSLLADLDEASLICLGVNDPLHRLKLVKISGGWLPKS